MNSSCCCWTVHAAFFCWLKFCNRSLAFGCFFNFFLAVSSNKFFSFLLCYWNSAVLLESGCNYRAWIDLLQLIIIFVHLGTTLNVQFEEGNWAPYVLRSVCYYLAQGFLRVYALLRATWDESLTQKRVQKTFFRENKVLESGKLTQTRFFCFSEKREKKIFLHSHNPEMKFERGWRFPNIPTLHQPSPFCRFCHCLPPDYFFLLHYCYNCS